MERLSSKDSHRSVDLTHKACEACPESHQKSQRGLLSHPVVRTHGPLDLV